MKFFDTNVVVRLVIRDDPALFERANGKCVAQN